MKTRLITAAMLLCAAMATAKDIKTVVLTTQPQMHCESCENRIKNNLRFEKGIKKIETDIEHQAVTITYDADKTDIEAIVRGFKKIDYEATVKQDNNGSCCSDSSKSSCGAAADKSATQDGCCTVKR